MAARACQPTLHRSKARKQAVGESAPAKNNEVVEIAVGA